MLIPYWEKGRWRFSNGVYAPKRSLPRHAAFRAFSTNHPSPAGARPRPFFTSLACFTRIVRSSAPRSVGPGKMHAPHRGVAAAHADAFLHDAVRGDDAHRRLRLFLDRDLAGGL